MTIQVCITGQFNRGSRDNVRKELESFGAIIAKDVSGKVDYLIVGGYGNSSWAYGNYGSKVKKALEYQEQGKDIKIVSEEELFNCLTITV